MSIILFILALAILILVHEFGHFITAKKLGMKVDEFGIGFPPRIFSIKKGETEYSLNIVPLGGFVKIFGENPSDAEAMEDKPDEETTSGDDKDRSMVNKPKWMQATVISAGVVFNILFAWLLISIGFMVGLPVSANQAGFENVKDQRIVIMSVTKNSPAQKAGLSTGDKLVSLGDETGVIKDFDEDQMQQFISMHGGEEISLVYERGKGNLETAKVTPVDGILEDQSAIGISTNVIGTAQLPLYKAIWEGLKLTLSLLVAVAIGLVDFVLSLFNGTGSFNQLTGPVGIVGMVKDASTLGWIYLLNFVAFISINLAVINSIPFPALDGGRFLVIFIEAVTRKDIKPIILNTLNLVGFVLLIFLMVAVTYNDIVKLF